jgi:hypothetical protein
MYHGTTEKFGRFNPDLTEDSGLHFGTREQALHRVGDKGHKNLRQVNLRITNPKRVQDQGGSAQWYDEIQMAKQEGHDGMVYLNRYEVPWAEHLEADKQPGGVHALSDDEFKKYAPSARDSWIAFKANQVKDVKRKDGDGCGSTFSSGDLNSGGRLAPQQGMFRKPRRSRNVNNSEFLQVAMEEGGNTSISVPLTMIPTTHTGGRKRPGHDEEPSDQGGPLFPHYTPGAGSSVHKFDEDQPRDNAGRWTMGSGAWIKPDGEQIEVRREHGGKASIHDAAAVQHGFKNISEAVEAGWVRTTSSSDGSMAHVQFNGENSDARRNAGSYVRDAFKGDVSSVYIDRGNGQDGNFGELGPAMRFVHQGIVQKDGMGQVTGGGSGDGDSFATSFMAHTFTVGRLQDGAFEEDPSFKRVNPYEALFLKRGVRLGWQAPTKKSARVALAKRAVEVEEQADRVVSSLVGSRIEMRKDRLAEFGFGAEDVQRILRALGVERSVPAEDDPVLNRPGSKRPRRYPDVGEEMGFNDTYDALAKVAKSGQAVAIDFDGTCTVGADGEENPKMRKLVEALGEKGVPVTIFTARDKGEVEEWLLAHKWPDLPVTNEKSPDFKVMLDDRGVSFEPTMLHDIPALTEALSQFKTWWEKSAGPREPSVSKTVDMVEAGRVVVRHVFFGDDLAEVRHMVKAHREADASLDAALDGRPYKGVDIEVQRDPAITTEKAEAWDPKKVPFMPGASTVEQGKYESQTRKAIREEAEKAADDAEMARAVEVLNAERAVEDAKTTERAETVKAAVAEILPVLKDHDAVVAAVVEKLTAVEPKSKGFRQILHRGPDHRVTHVDNVPL